MRPNGWIVHLLGVVFWIVAVVAGSLIAAAGFPWTLAAGIAVWFGFHILKNRGRL